MNTPRIFVVIPVYNAEATLSACTSSLKAQTFTDWQAVLVDDGSTDGSAALCDAICAADSRFQVIHQPNGGPTAARNAGMDIMRGEAVTFLDSDDILPPEFLQELWNALEGRDLVICSIEEHRLDGSQQRMALSAKGYSTAAYLRALVLGEFPPLLALSCVNKLYRIDLLQQYSIRQPANIHRGEDAVFNLRYLHHARQIAAIDTTSYRYLRHENSLMSRHVESIAAGEGQLIRLLCKECDRLELTAEASFCRHLSQYRMQSFFFSAYCVTGAALGKKRTAALLRGLLCAGIIGAKDVTAARGNALPWWLLQLVVTLKSGFGMLAWLILAGKLHWA